LITTTIITASTVDGFLMKRVVGILLSVALTVSFIVMTMSQASENQKSVKEPSADQIWASLVDGNRRFIDGKPNHQDLVSLRHTLSKNQHPLVAVLSCSDSRVPPEVVFDQGLGDLFVVRVAGNSSEPIGIGSLEYAVKHLGTVMIVVLGHQSCGAVTAACSGEKIPTSNLEALVQPIAPSCKVAKQAHSDESLLDLAIKDHVGRTAQSLLTHSQVLKHAHDEGKLAIVEAYYSLDSGVVTRLH
jgi:carbonic anhydrase